MTTKGGSSPSSKPKISVYLEEELFEALQLVASEDGRKPPNLVAHLVRMALPSYQKGLEKLRSDVQESVNPKE